MNGASEARQLLDACDRHQLTEWETEFVRSCRARFRPLTEKQLAILRRIAAGDPNYQAINNAALPVLAEILERWAPGGKVSGHEYIALNPKRSDTRLGSFRINLNTGQWAEFAPGAEAQGGDVVSLAAWLFDLSQPKAAEHLATMLRLDIGGGV